MTTRLLSLALLLLSAPLAAPLLAHEGDPKLLDLRAPYRGPGFKAAPGGTDQPLLGGSGGPPVAFEAQGVQLMSWLTLDELGAGNMANDCWGYTSPSGRRYAVIGHAAGCTWVEVTDPGNAAVVAQVPGAGGLWGDVKVYQEHAYYVSESGGGVVVMDLSQIDQGSVQVVGTVTAGGILSTHNLAVDTTSGFLYRCGGTDNGLRIYSLADPASPQLVGTWSNRYVHDAQVVTYTSGPFAGRQIAFVCSGFGNGASQTRFEVLDVTNKNQIFTRDQVFYSSAAYSHQVWIDAERQYAYLNDEMDEGGGVTTRTIVFDISDLDDLAQVSTFTNGNTAIGHNLYVRGDRIYEANYRSGLRIFDATDRVQPVEVAWFDTWPDNDLPTYNGLWSCYPFFDNATILGSDREKGLFVWWEGAPQVAFDVVGGVPPQVPPGDLTLDLTLGESVPGILDVASPLLCYDAGAGPQVLPLLPVGGGQWTVTIPGLVCGTELRWYVAARSTDGIEWRAPAGAPVASHRTLVLDGSSALAAFDFETDQGWVTDLPGDTTGPGRWRRVEPVGTSGSPDEDITPLGTQCWTTGTFQSVSGGGTTLLSPAFDLSDSDDPWFEYWAWFSAESDGLNSTDSLWVYLSDDDGQTWVEADRVRANSPQADFGWFFYDLRVRDFVAATSKVRLKFFTDDDGAPNVVEAAVDEVRLVDRTCADCGFERFCASSSNSSGLASTIHASGSGSVAASDLVLRSEGAVPGQFGLFYYGPDVVQVPFGDGLRCVGAGASGVFRLGPAQTVGPDGVTLRPLDLQSPPTGSGPGTIDPGSTWRFQFWYRDPFPGGSGFNLSDGLTVRFCP